jgi:hypothetical protein
VAVFVPLVVGALVPLVVGALVALVVGVLVVGREVVGAGVTGVAGGALVAGWALVVRGPLS